MATPVRLPEEMEGAVRFVEDTPPVQIVEATLERLRNGAAARELLAASALAVTRSTELPADHHGGPVHPVSGIQAVFGAAQRLEGDWGLMPVVHSVALANKHIHHPMMGPAIMAELPAEGAGTGDLEADKAAFKEALARLKPKQAERLMIGLLPRCGPGEILDLMLPAAIRRNPLDDHYFLYPVLAIRAVETVGWEWAGVVLRAPVRYLATNARSLGIDTEGELSTDYVTRNLAAYHRFDEEAGPLMEQYGLLERDVAEKTSAAEDAAVAALAEEIGACDVYADIPEMIARALADGLSLEGTCEAMSAGASTLHLRSDYGNPFDVHFMTGMNARRYVLSHSGVSRENKVLALLSWSHGPEIRLAEHKMVWPARTDAATIAALPDRDQDALLDVITEEIVARPRKRELEERGGVEKMFAGEETHHIMMLAQQYAEKGYDAGALLRRMGEIMCRDDFAEMHTFKHLQGAVEEYEATRAPLRWVHLVSAVKETACSYGLSQGVYSEACSHLAI